MKPLIQWRRTDATLAMDDADENDELFDKRWNDALKYNASGKNQIDGGEYKPGMLGVVSPSGLRIRFMDEKGVPKSAPFALPGQLATGMPSNIICGKDADGFIIPGTLPVNDYEKLRFSVEGAASGSSAKLLGVTPETLPYLEDFATVKARIDDILKYVPEARLAVLHPVWFRSFSSEHVPGRFGIRNAEGMNYCVYDGIAWLAAFGWNLKLSGKAADELFLPWSVFDEDLCLLGQEYCTMEVGRAAYHFTGKEGRMTMMGWLTGLGRARVENYNGGVGEKAKAAGNGGLRKYRPEGGIRGNREEQRLKFMTALVEKLPSHTLGKLLKAVKDIPGRSIVGEEARQVDGFGGRHIGVDTDGQRAFIFDPFSRAYITLTPGFEEKDTGVELRFIYPTFRMETGTNPDAGINPCNVHLGHCGLTEAEEVEVHTMLVELGFFRPGKKLGGAS